MTGDEIKAILNRVLTWPQEKQEAAAELLLWIEAGHEVVYQPGEEEWAAIREGVEQADRGEFVSEAEMAALFRRHGQ